MRIHVLHDVAYNFAEKINHSFQSSAVISGFTQFFFTTVFIFVHSCPITHLADMWKRRMS